MPDPKKREKIVEGVQKNVLYTEMHYPLLPVATRCNGCQLADTRYYPLLPVVFYPDPLNVYLIFGSTREKHALRPRTYLCRY